MKKIICLLVTFSVLFGSLQAVEKKQKKKGKKTRAPLVIPAVSADKQICFALYTVQDSVLKMNVQFYPLPDEAPRVTYLEIEGGGQWNRISEASILDNDYGMGDGTKSWTALFRVVNWDHSKNWNYRVVHGNTCFYTGIVRCDPKDKNEIVVAGFTGNSNRDRGMKPDIIHNIKAHDPDLLFFSGDQSYDHKQHLAAWLLFGRQFGEIIKDRPTICLPDDHDVGQGNLWGHGGRKSKVSAGHDGGYFHPAQYVNEVQRAQTANLPDAYYSTPVEQNIGVYYTSLNVGGIDFAIIEDRKFKTGPSEIIPKMGPRPDHINDPKYDPKKVDVPEARLLGERQLKFLNEWGKDWKGAEMKAVLSQSVFANAAHIHHGKRLIADLDSNGWPQTGRNKAIDEIRKSFSLMIGGDQHLATVIHHGVDEWNDGGFSFCVPSIVNFYPRKWSPLEKGVNPVSDKLDHTGQFLDGFHNNVTMYAYANPDENEIMNDKWREDGIWGKLAAGHGIIRFNKGKRSISMECWPRGSNVTKPDAKQFVGWPVNITQEDNYGRKASAWLPMLNISGIIDPVVQVIEEGSQETIYSIRIKGNTFTPKVFKIGSYTVRIGDGDKLWKELKGIGSIDSKKGKTIDVKF